MNTCLISNTMDACLIGFSNRNADKIVNRFEYCPKKHEIYRISNQIHYNIFTRSLLLHHLVFCHVCNIYKFALLDAIESETRSVVVISVFILPYYRYRSSADAAPFYLYFLYHWDSGHNRNLFLFTARSKLHSIRSIFHDLWTVAGDREEPLNALFVIITHFVLALAKLSNSW